jgi:stearoyl-CoA desaturase (Delta-9 desaturase)
LDLPLSYRVANVLGIALPAAGFLLAIVLLWNEAVGAADVGIMLGMYLITGAGISVGFHRLFAHRSFEAARPVRAALAILASMAMMGGIFRWVSNHRKHHAFSDEDGDPHSPHLTERGGAWGAVTGLWHAHVGWIFTSDRPDPERYARHLVNDPMMRFIDRTFLVWVGVGLAIPFLAGFAISGRLEGALTGLLWGGPARIFALHHVTFSINSLCHFHGRRRFPTADESRNLFWLAPISFGEAWHNNHHAFPSSPFHGLRRREIDPGRWLILGLEALGLAWNVRRVGPERQLARAAGTK